MLTWKNLAVSLVSFALAGSIAHAETQDAQLDLDLEAAALAQIVHGDAAQNFEYLAEDAVNPFGFLDGLKAQLEGIKATLLATFDTDGNGKIDAGAEAEGFKTGIQAIVMLLADSNQNGKIDAEDIAALTTLALDKVKDAALTKICPGVYQQVEASGQFLNFRPVLKKLNAVCLEHDAAL